MAGRRLTHRVPAGRWLPDLEAAMRGVRTRGDPEAVHELRVALARAQVFLRMANETALAREVRWLRKLAGPVRDADVRRALEVSSPNPARLDQRRRKALAALVGHLEGDRARSLFRALHAVEPLAPRRLKRGLRRLSRRALERKVKPGADAATLHALRRALRKARYAFELAGLPTRALTALQETLGEVQDLSLRRPAGRAQVVKLAGARARARRQWPEVERLLEAAA